MKQNQNPKKGKNKYLSIKYSCPEPIIKLWRNAYGDEITVGMLELLDGRPPISARTNTLKTSADKLIALLDEEGVEISGGEAQKIAIARALYKNAPFIVLDEPTAALDPKAEAEIYGQLNEIVEDRTAIFISHRLSSCRFCDEIAVFDEGQIVQQGRHEDLLKDEDGKYYELWNAQAKYYQ